MRTTLLKTFAFLALTSVFVLAQHGNPPDQAQMAQHHVDHLTKQLSLTPQQQQQATTLFTEVLKNSKTMHDQLRTAHESLRTAVQKNDTAAIEQISNSIGNLTAQETMTHAKAMATFYQTLTPEQQSKFAEAVHHGMGGEMGMHGHGGPGGPPPGASFQ
ncbi:MAG TPA: Spy/CpxP family protein refolding chaperone [Candidatus Sulfotelmatobacter sp.]|nr:Spy/CpxP family protein refolding chaperone [Candidatus Sulfotelmatobacter sp.]